MNSPDSYLSGFFKTLFLLLLVWGIGATVDRVLFFQRADQYGGIHRRLVGDLPEGKCLSATHLEFQKTGNEIIYRCSVFGGGLNIWPFYQTYQSTEIPEVVSR